MTEARLRPQETVGTPWTGFVLLLVPTPDLPVPAAGLHQWVQAQVRSDVTLLDLTSLALARPDADDDSVASTLLAAAGPLVERAATAVVFGLVVVGGQATTVADVSQRLDQHPLLRQLHATSFPVVATDLESTVDDVVALAEQLMTAYEREPALAVPASRLPTLAPLVAPATSAARLGTTSATEAESVAAQETPALPAQPWTWWRRTRSRLGADLPRLGEPYWLDHLAQTAPTAALVTLVLVPDHNPPTRPLAARRQALALDLDAALGGMSVDPGTGRKLNVAVEIFTASSPPSRARGVRPAGILVAGELPAVPVESFDIYETVDFLDGALDRATRALARRHLDLTGTQVIFLATSAPYASTLAVQRFGEFAQRRESAPRMVVHWVQLGHGDPVDAVFAAGHEDRVFLRPDHDDVVSEVLADAAALYGLPEPAPTDEISTVDIPAEIPGSGR